ncbi:MAG: DUF2235 domain-containing protein [Pseudomonadota bacterium]
MVLLDGTMSTLSHGCETNIGLIYRLLMDLPDDAGVTLYYEPGIQWRGFRRLHEVLAGVGINRQIRRAYLFLARNYQPGDKVVLMGFSRGAYAVRSLAGLIDRIGLLRPAQISEETLDRVYHLYRTDPGGAEAQALRASLCHPEMRIAFMGVFDTVRALGIRWPFLWRFAGTPHPYHNHTLGPATQVARHALALDEMREAYTPVLWEAPLKGSGDVVQMWFRGTHGDVGGQLNGRNWARPLSNISLAWMLGEAQAAGLPLPPDWRHRYVTDPGGRSIGRWAGWSKVFLARRRRVVGRYPSEALHPSVEQAGHPARLPPPQQAAAE